MNNVKNILFISLLFLLNGCGAETSESDNTKVQHAQEEQILLNDDIVDNATVETADVEDEEALDQNIVKQELASEKKISVKTEDSNNQNLGLTVYFYLAAGLLIAVLIFLTITIYLLAKEVRWRKRHTKNESIIFPDAHLDVLDNLKNAWDNLHKNINAFKDLGISSQKENEIIANKTLDSLSKLNSTIDAQRDEINRLKEGYDFSIKKHSVFALIEIKELVEGYLDEHLNDEENKKLSKIHGYVNSNLEDLDIEEFRFDAGASIRDLSSDEFEIDSVESTSENELHEKVKETSKKGYSFIHANGKNILRKAKLKVYKKEN